MSAFLFPYHPSHKKGYIRNLPIVYHVPYGKPAARECHAFDNSRGGFCLLNPAHADRAGKRLEAHGGRAGNFFRHAVAAACRQLREHADCPEHALRGHVSGWPFCPFHHPCQACGKGKGKEMTFFHSYQILMNFVG